MNPNLNNPLQITVDLINQSTEIDLSPSRLVLACCIEGTAVIDQDSECKANDFVLLNRGEKHQLACQENTLVILFSMNYYVLCNYKGCDSLFFFCNSTLESGNKYQELKLMLAELCKTYVTDGENSLKFTSESIALQSCLLDHFVQETSEADIRSLSKNQRLQMIADYIYVNSTEKISLQKLAEKLYLSPSTLSRTFSEMSGESFVSFVRRVRLEKVSQELIHSEKSITSIAVDNGFSNASAMSSAFRDQYGLLPSEYRSQYQVRRSFDEHKEKLAGQLARSLNRQSEAENPAGGDSVIRLSFAAREEEKKWENKILNLGAARNLNSAKIREHLLFLKDQLGIEYVRIWDIFCGDLFIRDNSGRELSFVKIDALFDFCVEHGFKVFLDLAPRDEILMANEKNALYNNRRSIQFESKAAWESFLRQFLRHLIQRYGKQNLSGWIFEFEFMLTHQPYYLSRQYHVLDTWDTGYEIIKSELPDALVVGPGLILFEDAVLLRRIVDHFFSARHKPDLFTNIQFPYRASEGEGDLQKNMAGTFEKIADDLKFLQSGIKKVSDLLSDANYTGKHLVTEWNFSISNRSYLQDSCFRGSYLMENVLKNRDDCDTLGLWHASDLIDASYDTTRLLSGSSGLMTIDGICKPSFYAFSFLKNMGRYRLYKRNGLLVTADSCDQFYILCCHTSPLNVKYYLTEETEYAPGDIDTLFHNTEPLTLQLVIENLSEGALYTVRSLIVNRAHGSVLDNWIHFSLSKTLSLEDIRYLRQISIPQRTLEQVRVEHGKLSLSLTLEPDEIRAVSITRVPSA